MGTPPMHAVQKRASQIDEAVVFIDMASDLRAQVGRSDRQPVAKRDEEDLYACVRRSQPAHGFLAAKVW